MCFRVDCTIEDYSPVKDIPLAVATGYVHFKNLHAISDWLVFAL
jgi:hypothetical protein